MSNHANDDYEKTRDFLYELQTDAKDALDLAKEILRESEHPRAVEVYSGLLNNVTKLTAQILDLSKTHKDINERKSHKDAAVETVTLDEGGQQYIGSTADLQKMIKEARLIEQAKLIDVTPSED
jgi:fumarylacetoacetate (FAA) hydrolase family protein